MIQERGRNFCTVMGILTFHSVFVFRFFFNGVKIQNNQIHFLHYEWVRQKDRPFLLRIGNVHGIARQDFRIIHYFVARVIQDVAALDKTLIISFNWREIHNAKITNEYFTFNNLSKHQFNDSNQFQRINLFHDSHFKNVWDFVLIVFSNKQAGRCSQMDYL